MRILMTGCSSGVGQTIRWNLGEQGHKVIGVGQHGPEIRWDFRDLRGVDMWAMNLFADAGPFQCLINNAGMTHIDMIEDHTTEDFEAVIGVNLIAPFALSRAFLRSIPEKNAGDPWPMHVPRWRIINTGSMGTQISMRGSPGYCAAKAGLEALTKQMAKELAGKKPVGVYCICPGTIENTQMSEQVIKEMQRTRGWSEEKCRAYAMQSPLGRAAAHDEVWRLFDFCVNKAPLSMSGSVIRMPAGMGV